MWLCARAFVVPSVIAVLALSAQTGWSETQTIKIVVPNPPGASPDILARLLAEQIGRAEGAALVIENRPADELRTDLLPRQFADGYCRQQQIALPNARRFAECGTHQTQRVDHSCGWSRNGRTNGLRDAQACGSS